jgi:hypothetical protein
MSDDKNKKVSVVVFALGIICAFLIGLIIGFIANLFLFNTGCFISHYEHLSPSIGHEFSDHFIRRDILFHEPGNNELWNDNYLTIPTGKGSIETSVFIDDKPAKDLKLCLLLASGRATEPAVVDSEGKAHFHLPSGKYFLNGILLFNMSEEVNDKIFVNRIAYSQKGNFALANLNGDSVNRLYEDLQKRYGKDKAADSLAERLIVYGGFEDRFPFEVAEKTYRLPALHYRTPVALVLPACGTSISLEALKFVWKPYPNATSYNIRIQHIKQNGTSTFYTPLAQIVGWGDVAISTKEIEKCAMKDFNENCRKKFVGFQAGQYYSVNIIALSNRDGVLSASQEGDMDQACRFGIKGE